MAPGVLTISITHSFSDISLDCDRCATMPTYSDNASDEVASRRPANPANDHHGTSARVTNRILWHRHGDAEPRELFVQHMEFDRLVPAIKLHASASGHEVAWVIQYASLHENGLLALARRVTGTFASLDENEAVAPLAGECTGCAKA